MKIAELLNAPPQTQRKLGVVLSYVNIFITAIITLIYTPFFLRILGQSEFGLFSLANSVVGYLAILDLGFGNAVVVYTAQYIAKNDIEKESELHGTVFCFYLIMSAISLIIGILLIFFAPEIFSGNLNSAELVKLRIMFALLVFNVVLSIPLSIYSSILTAYENFIFLKIISILKNILLPIISIPFLILGYKSVTIVLILIFINLITIFSIYIFYRRKLNYKINPKNFNLHTFKIIFSYSCFIFLGMIVDQVNWNVDNFILGVVTCTKEVSLYAVANIINSMFIALSVAISGVMLPKISKMVSQNSTNEDLTREFIKIGRIQFYIIFFICSATIIFGREFILFWAGSNYEISYYIAIILVIPVSIPLIQNLGIAIIQSKNKYKFKAIASFLMTIVNILISIPLAKRYGGIGCAIGTACSLIVLNIFIMNYYYHYEIGLNILYFWVNILKMFLTFIIPVAIIIPLILMLNLDGILNLLICGGIYTLMYAYVAFRFSMNEYERNMLYTLAVKFRLKYECNK